MVRLDRTFSDYSFTGAICTSSMRFKHIEPHRTFSNYILTEIARYIDFGVVRLYRTFSTYSSSGDTRCAGCNLHRFKVEAYLTSSNLLYLHPHRDSKVYRVFFTRVWGAKSTEVEAYYVLPVSHFRFSWM